MNSPNVNFFVSYVDCLSSKNKSPDFIKENYEKRQFYSCNKDFDHVGYVLRKKKKKLNYVEYSGNNEKSHGIFNQNGLLNADEIKKLRNQLRQTRSVIWHGVISFTEEFGNKYCNNTEKAQMLMKYELPKFFRQAGLNPNNIIWFAGLHENTDNKHIHFSFFEKQPLRFRQNSKKRCFSDGFIDVKAIRKAKESIEMKLLNISKDLVDKRNSLSKEFKKIEIGVFMKNIKELIMILPLSGRLSYESENIEQYKQKINNIVNALIVSNPSLSQKISDYDTILAARDEEVKKIYKKLKMNPTDKLMREKYMKDLYRRLGNIVLKVVKDIRTQQKKYDYETKNRLVQKRIDKAKRKVLFKNCERLNNLATKEVIIAFQEFLHKLDEVNYKRLKEEGLIDESS